MFNLSDFLRITCSILQRLNVFSSTPLDELQWERPKMISFQRASSKRSGADFHLFSEELNGPFFVLQPLHQVAVMWFKSWSFRISLAVPCHAAKKKNHLNMCIEVKRAEMQDDPRAWLHWKLFAGGTSEKSRKRELKGYLLATKGCDTCQSGFGAQCLHAKSHWKLVLFFICCSCTLEDSNEKVHVFARQALVKIRLWLA